jgi:hypothetical protein
MAREGDLLHHLQGVTGLESRVLEKILAEIDAWFDEDLTHWTRRHHRELQRQGLHNRDIYPRLREAARTALVRPGPLTERQIRRLIYG